MQFEANRAPDLYQIALEAVLQHGDRTMPRGVPTRELRGVSLRLNQPDQANLVDRKGMNIRFAMAEFAWILTGQNSTALITKFNKQIGNYSDDGNVMAGAYGPPLADQLPWVIQQLRDDPDTRQAVLTLWRPRPAKSKDIPCTLSMQFFIRSGKLEMMTTMRSNDCVLGFPYDVFVFTMIQRYVASALACQVGTYHHHVGSFHVYERDVDAAHEHVRSPRVYHDTMDLTTEYPYPLELLQALVVAPYDVAWRDLTTWRNSIGLLIPSLTSKKWQQIIDAHGVEPLGFKDYDGQLSQLGE
mgnify:CR=1 FL=1